MIYKVTAQELLSYAKHSKALNLSTIPTESFRAFHNILAIPYIVVSMSLGKLAVSPTHLKFSPLKIPAMFDNYPKRQDLTLIAVSVVCF